MALLTIVEYKSTRLESDYNQISTIEIEESSFSEGGFGEVYRCISINGTPPPKDQVIKLFIDNRGSAHKGYQTIRKLQDKLISKANELKKNSKDLLEEYPGLKGCPQFSFKAKFKGKEKFGYSANDLKSLGFIEFKEILDDKNKLTDFQKVPLANKLLIAYHLVNTFDLFYRSNYIHADFKDEAIFINNKTVECAIIDYDSGAVIQSTSDKPTTWGTQQPWLAPEIYAQYGSEIKKRKRADEPIRLEVNLYSDMWSVAVCIFYLIFGVYPFFFFTHVSIDVFKEYADNNLKFPEISDSFKFLNRKKNILDNHKIISNVVNRKIPTELRNKLIQTFSKGALHPSVRTTYSQWRTILKTTQSPPKIVSFSPRNIFLSNGIPVLFKWSVNNASSLSLNGLNVTGKKKYELEIRKDTVISFTAENSFGQDTATAKVTVSKEKPDIGSFKTNLPSNIVRSKDKIILSWNISGANQVVGCVICPISSPAFFV